MTEREQAYFKITSFYNQARQAIDNIRNEQRAITCLKKTNAEEEIVLKALDIIWPTKKIDGTSD